MRPDRVTSWSKMVIVHEVQVVSKSLPGDFVGIAVVWVSTPVVVKAWQSHEDGES